jgi:hypothetical protein
MTHIGIDLPTRHCPCARHDFVLVHVETGAALMDDVHSTPPAWRGAELANLQSTKRAPVPTDGRHVDTVCDAAPAPGPT